MPETGPGDAIRAAQEKLAALRRQHGISNSGRRAAETITNYELRITNQEGRTLSPLLPGSPAQDTKYEIRNTNEEDASNSPLDSRISYFSETLAAHLRAAAARREQAAAAGDREWLNRLRVTSGELRVQNESGTCSPARMTNDACRMSNEPGITLSPLLPGSPAQITNGSVAPNSSLDTRHSSLIKVFPDIALGMLRTKTAAPGRVWLLLRHGDSAGRGRLSANDATRLLAGDGSPLRVCGRRQLANLLAAGDGLFWDRDTGRDGQEWLRLRSAVRVAAGLGVPRLAGSPVAVPLSALTGTIGQARAHLYASFHSGRSRTDLLTGEKRARGPISRTTLCKLSGAAANSQRNYERRARVGRRSAIAIGPRVSAADEQETAWRRGRAMFRFRDDKGRHGRPGAVYLAWQLPNEYTGPHDTLPRGRLKRLNRALADLFHDGMTGNSGRAEGRVAGGRWQVAGAQYPVSSEQYPASRSVGQWVSREVRSEQYPVVSGSVGQWVGDRPGHPFSPAPFLPCALSAPAPQRRFYNSAKAAHGARHDGERYWRYGGVWLWQPELRVKSDELRVQTARRLLPADDRRPPTADCPAAHSCSTDPLTHHPIDLLDTGHCSLDTVHLAHSKLVTRHS